MVKPPVDLDNRPELNDRPSLEIAATRPDRENVDRLEPLLALNPFDPRVVRDTNPVLPPDRSTLAVVALVPEGLLAPRQRNFDPAADREVDRARDVRDARAVGDDEGATLERVAKGAADCDGDEPARERRVKLVALDCEGPRGRRTAADFGVARRLTREACENEPRERVALRCDRAERELDARGAFPLRREGLARDTDLRELRWPCDEADREACELDRSLEPRDAELLPLWRCCFRPLPNTSFGTSRAPPRMIAAIQWPSLR